MKLIGIDPGSKGAIVEIDTNEKTCRYMKLTFRHDEILDCSFIKQFFSFASADFIYCEQIHGMKIWGVSNNFRFGGIYWMVRMMISGYPYSIVTPQEWQKVAHQGMKRVAGEAKKRTKEAFVRLNPSSDLRDTDVMDAYFIARYAGFANSVTVPNDLLFIEVI